MMAMAVAVMGFAALLLAVNALLLDRDDKLLGYGVTGIWLAFPLTNFIMALIYLSVFHKRKWQNKKIINTEEKIVNTVIKERNLEEIIRVE